MKSDRSWLLKQESSITVESRVQMTLRKETYVKVPKLLTPGIKIEETSKDVPADEFDDSLSPKPVETETPNPQSEMSKLLSDIKFTPFKKSPTTNNDALEFSPTCCSTGHKTKSFSDSESGNRPEISNKTFDIDSANNSEKNSTYELPASPTSTKAKNNFNLKPTCLAKTFDKSNFDVGFSTPLPVKSHFNAANDSVRYSNQFSRIQTDCGSAKECLEADLWVKGRNNSLSPISKNLMHSTLDSIIEEDTHANNNEDKVTAHSRESSKKLSPKAFCIEISPPAKHPVKSFKPPLKKISPTKNGRVTKEKKEKMATDAVNGKKKVQINKSITSESYCFGNN